MIFLLIIDFGFGFFIFIKPKQKNQTAIVIWRTVMDNILVTKFVVVTQRSLPATIYLKRLPWLTGLLKELTRALKGSLKNIRD